MHTLRVFGNWIPCLWIAEPTCENEAIRLSPDGPTSNEGRVEICYENVWGAVYDGNWTQYDAAVVCNQLGRGFNRYGW